MIRLPQRLNSTFLETLSSHPQSAPFKKFFSKSVYFSPQAKQFVIPTLHFFCILAHREFLDYGFGCEVKDSFINLMKFVGPGQSPTSDLDSKGYTTNVYRTMYEFEGKLWRMCCKSVFINWISCSFSYLILIRCQNPKFESWF